MTAKTASFIFKDAFGATAAGAGAAASGTSDLGGRPFAFGLAFGLAAGFGLGLRVLFRVVFLGEVVDDVMMS